MSKDHFQLTAVEALPDYRLRLTYADVQTFEVDLRSWIETTEALLTLKDPALFAQARIDFAGRSVDWIEDELDLGANSLRNLAIEQAGGIGHERIWNWLHETGLTLEQAVEALGISGRMLIYSPVPFGWPVWAGKPCDPQVPACLTAFPRLANTPRCPHDW